MPLSAVKGGLKKLVGQWMSGKDWGTSRPKRGGGTGADMGVRGLFPGGAKTKEHGWWGGGGRHVRHKSNGGKRTFKGGGSELSAGKGKRVPIIHPVGGGMVYTRTILSLGVEERSQPMVQWPRTPGRQSNEQLGKRPEKQSSEKKKFANKKKGENGG